MEEAANINYRSVRELPSIFDLKSQVEIGQRRQPRRQTNQILNQKISAINNKIINDDVLIKILSKVKEILKYNQ